MQIITTKQMVTFLAFTVTALAELCTVVKNDPFVFRGTSIICNNVTNDNVFNLNSVLKLVYMINTDRIVFSNSKINILPRGVFENLDHINNLYLDNIQLRDIQEGAFLGLYNLTELNLQHNNLSHVQAEQFEGLKALKYLHLSYNNISDVKSDSFINLHHLHLLKLDHNAIQNFSENFVFNNVKLHTIDLSFNKIEWMNGSFEKNSHLAKLILNNNHIFDFTVNLTPCSVLRLLNISSNRVNLLNTKLWPRSLEILDITNNNIDNISLRDFINLQFIFAAKNSISYLTSFRSLRNLKVLNLECNYITVIEEAAFLGSTSLSELNLSQNKIRKIDFGGFNYLKNLTFLDLSYNKLVYIEERVFYILTNLESLNLSFNEIEDINVKHLIDHCGNLKNISLHNNNILCSVKVVNMLQEMNSIKIEGLNCKHTNDIEEHFPVRKISKHMAVLLMLLNSTLTSIRANMDSVNSSISNCFLLINIVLGVLVTLFICNFLLSLFKIKKSQLI